MTLLPDELAPGTCPAAWHPVSADAAVRLPYYAQHGSPSSPHECTLDAHDDAIPTSAAAAGVEIQDVKASQIVRHRPEFRRPVSVDVPEGRSAVGLAVGMLHDLGIDVDIVGRSLVIEVGPVFAGPVAMAMERYTGIRADNGWERR